MFEARLSHGNSDPGDYTGTNIMLEQPAEIEETRQNETRRQHMAPQSYLRRFALNPTAAPKLQRVWTYDKTQKRTFPAAIVNVAQERDFNDLPLDVMAGGYAEHVKTPEKAFSKAEGGFKTALDNFAQNWEETGIPLEARPPLAAVLAVQMMRTRAMRARMAVTLGDLSPKQLQAVLDGEIAPETGRAHVVAADTPEDLARLGQLGFLFDPERMMAVCRHLTEDYLWFVGVNEYDVPLYTSDNPVAFWCEREPFEGAPDIATTAFGAPGMRLAFPVTPKLLILLFERTAWSEMASEEGSAIVCKEEDIALLNSLQVMGSYRQVFCQMNAFDLAEKMCATMPDLCDPDARIRALLNAPQLTDAEAAGDVAGSTVLASSLSAFLSSMGVAVEGFAEPKRES